MRDEGQQRPDAVAALAARLDALGETRGAWEPLGPRHAALFADEGQETLLVTFERLDLLAEAGAETAPRGLARADARGWSALTLLAEGETGWREPRVWRYLDRLVDDGFFEDFDHVLFYGAGLAGHAAAACSVAAPGAHVLALAPRATLDPRRSDWDRRHPHLRRSDWTSRYADAPLSLEGAAQATVIHDPAIPEDAMHASLFAAAHVLRLGWTGIGPDPEPVLEAMGLVDPLIDAAAAGTLTRAGAARIWRNRRDFAPWLRHLVARADLRGDPVFALRAARAVLARNPGRKLRRRVQDLEVQLGLAPTQD
jgi:hypothetical protein